MNKKILLSHGMLALTALITHVPIRIGALAIVSIVVVFLNSGAARASDTCTNHESRFADLEKRETELEQIIRQKWPEGLGCASKYSEFFKRNAAEASAARIAMLAVCPFGAVTFGIPCAFESSRQSTFEKRGRQANEMLRLLEQSGSSSTGELLKELMLSGRKGVSLDVLAGSINQINQEGELCEGDTWEDFTTLDDLIVAFRDSRKLSDVRHRAN